MKLLKGNNIDLLKTLQPNSVDSIITDPPYGLSFMNNKWDYDVPSVEFWSEVYRVLKPGGHILSFGGTRTYHRMVVNMEDAGFEIRDQIMWIYGSGFPKSLNIGKAIDKLEGNEREVVGKKTGGAYSEGTKNKGLGEFHHLAGREAADRGKEWGLITKGVSPYEGWGTGLKPANEPICLARKPLSEKTVAENVLKYSTGGINVDGCRIGNDVITTTINNGPGNNGIYGKYNGIEEPSFNEGRFPANVIFECICDEVIKGEKGEIKYTELLNTSGWKNTSKIKSVINHNDKADIHTNPDCPCRLLDEQSGESKSNTQQKVVEDKEAGQMYHRHEQPSNNYKQKVYIGNYSDKGGASRFFYVAKTSKKERNMGLDGFEEKNSDTTSMMWDKTTNGTSDILYERKKPLNKNNHPTVKPINLMVYLCRLITPKGGTILDPFMGSGSSGIAALLEGFDFIGMEMDDNYFDIAEGRINNYEEYRKLIK